MEERAEDRFCADVLVVRDEEVYHSRGKKGDVRKKEDEKACRLPLDPELEETCRDEEAYHGKKTDHPLLDLDIVQDEKKDRHSDRDRLRS